MDFKEELTATIGTSMVEWAKPQGFNAEQIAQDVLRPRPDLLKQLSNELDLTPEGTMELLKDTIRTLLKETTPKASLCSGRDKGQ